MNISPTAQIALSREQVVSGPAQSPPKSEFSEALRDAKKSTATDSEKVGRPGRQVVRLSRTKLSVARAAAALEQAWTKELGSPPTPEAVAILTAQWSHETGQGTSMYNNNFGGIKGVGPEGLTAAARTKEGYGAHEVKIVDHFRAYSTPESGAQDYVSLLRRKYPKALSAAQSGQAPEFVHALHQGGYFTGSPQAYTASVTRRANSYLQKGLGTLDYTNHPSTSSLSQVSLNVQRQGASSSLTQPSRPRQQNSALLPEKIIAPPTSNASWTASLASNQRFVGQQSSDQHDDSLLELQERRVSRGSTLQLPSSVLQEAVDRSLEDWF
ncbi:MAG: glucosaminidase domain-containing protein [Polyangiaceae bacterium]|nr:glucosaminidase domain-containing protein [Polyangiaceae bacterium]